MDLNENGNTYENTYANTYANTSRNISISTLNVVQCVELCFYNLILTFSKTSLTPVKDLDVYINAINENKSYLFADYKLRFGIISKRSINEVKINFEKNNESYYLVLNDNYMSKKYNKCEILLFLNDLKNFLNS